MHREWKAHVVRMVVEDDHLKGAARRAALNQWPAEVVEIAAAEQHGPMLRR